MPAQNAHNRAASQINQKKARGRAPVVSLNESSLTKQRKPGDKTVAEQTKDSKPAVRRSYRQNKEEAGLLELDEKGKTARPQLTVDFKGSEPNRKQQLILPLERSEDIQSSISSYSPTYESFLRRSLSHPRAFKSEILQDAQDLVSCIRTTLPTETDFQEPQRRAEAIVTKFKDFLQNSSSESDVMASSGLKAFQDRKGCRTASQASKLSTSIKVNLLQAANVIENEKYAPDNLLREQLLKDNSIALNKEKMGKWVMLLKQYNLADDVVEGLAELAEKEFGRNAENRWIANLEKSKVSYEAFLQHTIMLKTIDRFNYEDFKDNLDFSVELPWRSPSPPTTPLSSDDDSPQPLWDPKPDLCVGFRPRKIFVEDPHAYTNLPLDLKTLIVPEQLASKHDTPRAFPFLVLEVKGSSASVTHQLADTQASNAAAHALFNIWRCVQGNQDLEAEFLKKVRVFSAGAHPKEFWLKFHWAERLPKDSSAIIREDCPLRFVSEQVMELSGSNFTQARVQTTLKNLMRWTVTELSDFLQRAAERVLKKHKENKSNKNPDPPDGQPPQKKRRATEQNRDATPQDSQTDPDPSINGTGLTREVESSAIHEG